jgi:hypothetical protein
MWIEKLRMLRCVRGWVRNGLVLLVGFGDSFLVGFPESEDELWGLGLVIHFSPLYGTTQAVPF